MNIKQITKSVSLIQVSMIILSFPQTSAVVTYHYSEDFSDSSATQYELLGMRFNDTSVSSIDHKWEIDGGELVSDGLFNGPDHTTSIR